MSLLRFDDFMQEALYHPSEGYYTKGPKHVGKEGDFFTSVSVGSLFGELLCERFFLLWESLGKPDLFLVYELGANDGTLCADILQAAQKKEQAFAQALAYSIIEPLERLHPIQREKTQGKATIFSSLQEAKNRYPQSKGIVFGNELLDAFPVRLARYTPAGWQELFVEKSDNNTPPATSKKASLAYSWQEAPLEKDSSFPLSSLDYPLGYTTEWQDGLPSFFAQVEGLLEEGLFLFIDYGRNERSYYAPERQEGTLRTYYQHQRTDNPLLHVGEQDITADVNFTAVARAASKQGLKAQLFVEQAHWLTSLARPLLLAWEKELAHSPEEKTRKAYQKRIAQFQTLTHPSHMGTLFHVLELSKKTNSLWPLLSQRTGETTLWESL